MATNIQSKISAENFLDRIQSSDKPILADFWAPWCGPCRVLNPTIEALADEFDGEAEVVKINVDEHPGLARQFNVTSIPSLLFFADGELKERRTGVQTKETLSRILRGLA